LGRLRRKLADSGRGARGRTRVSQETARLIPASRTAIESTVATLPFEYDSTQELAEWTLTDAPRATI
jgi:hypothetical protein